jgi:hypothetical protein
MTDQCTEMFRKGAEGVITALQERVGRRQLNLNEVRWNMIIASGTCAESQKAMQQEEEPERTKTHLETMDKHEEQCLPHSRRLQHDLDTSLSGIVEQARETVWKQGQFAHSEYRHPSSGIQSSGDLFFSTVRKCRTP